MLYDATRFCLFARVHDGKQPNPKLLKTQTWENTCRNKYRTCYEILQQRLDALCFWRFYWTTVYSFHCIFFFLTSLQKKWGELQKGSWNSCLATTLCVLGAGDDGAGGVFHREKAPPLFTLNTAPIPRKLPLPPPARLAWHCPWQCAEGKSEPRVPKIISNQHDLTTARQEGCY